MKLHEKYTTSAAIRQVMIIEKERDFKKIGERCGIIWLEMSAYFNGVCRFSATDEEQFLQIFPYMSGRIG